jgi:hypothetical protein
MIARYAVGLRFGVAIRIEWQMYEDCLAVAIMPWLTFGLVNRARLINEQTTK